RIGAARGAARLGAALAGCRIVVVGDTPRDVVAARTIGATAIGVGSSRFSAAELLASGASRAFDDLSADCVLVAVAGQRRPLAAPPSPQRTTSTFPRLRPNRFAARSSGTKMSIVRPSTSRPVSRTTYSPV